MAHELITRVDWGCSVYKSCAVDVYCQSPATPTNGARLTALPQLEVMTDVVTTINSKLLAEMEDKAALSSTAVALGVAQDVGYYEEQFGRLRSTPIELLRRGLAKKGVNLPALIRTDGRR